MVGILERGGAVRVVVGLVTALAIGGRAVAEPSAISLDPFPQSNGVEVTQTQNITGTCGGSIVRVVGVKDITGDFFDTDLDTAQIIIRPGSAGYGQPYRERVIDRNGGVLSDYNGIACVWGLRGYVLLIWSVCGGTICGDDFSFTVIDPKTLRTLAPLKKSEVCDAKCAARFTGNNLPYELNKH